MFSFIAGAEMKINSYIFMFTILRELYLNIHIIFIIIIETQLPIYYIKFRNKIYEANILWVLPV